MQKYAAVLPYMPRSSRIIPVALTLQGAIHSITQSFLDRVTDTYAAPPTLMPRRLFNDLDQRIAAALAAALSERVNLGRASMPQIPGLDEGEGIAAHNIGVIESTLSVGATTL